jgi:hypothetical protein
MRTIFGHKRPSTPDSGKLTLRIASSDDADAIAQLAQLDSARTPPGPMLLAEIGDGIAAVLSLTDGSVLADPFQSTHETVKLLRERARELGC